MEKAGGAPVGKLKDIHAALDRRGVDATYL